MIVRIVTCHIKPGHEAAFEEATMANHLGSIAEPGVLRFDVLRDENPGTYYLYEVYRDEGASAAHKETVHYTVWREAVAEFMSEKRTSASCSVVAPRLEADW